MVMLLSLGLCLLSIEEGIQLWSRSTDATSIGTSAREGSRPLDPTRLSSSFLPSSSLQTRIPWNRRRQVGEWVNEAYALSLQEELDSCESTEERDSGEGESTEEMDSGDST